MDFNNIIKDLKNKVYHPVYFLSGTEPYYIDLVANFIENNVLDSTEKEFNQSVLYGKDVDVNTIISEAKRYPMMANHNVVIIKEAQHLSKEIENLAPYLNQPTKSTILVLCYKYKTLDGRKKITKDLKKQTVFLETKKLYDNQVPSWIVGYLKEKKYSISPQACILIAEFLGTDLSKIANELNKVIINVPQGIQITPEIVEKNIGISKDFNNFELNNAIGSRNIFKANQIIFHFAKNEKVNPIHGTIAVLYTFFTKLLKYHYLKDKSKNNVASALKISPFFVQDIVVAGRNYSIKKCVKVIEYLRNYDLKAKGVNNGITPTSELLKELLFKILH